jgi:hypothetical protein
MSARRHNARWAVVNAWPDEKAGNGVWAWCYTRLGALWTRTRIYQFRYHSGHYLIPAGGLDVRRVRSGRVS